MGSEKAAAKSDKASQDTPLAKSSKADGSAKSGKGEKTVDAKAEKVCSSAKAEKMSMPDSKSSKVYKTKSSKAKSAKANSVKGEHPPKAAPKGTTHYIKEPKSSEPKAPKPADSTRW